MLDTPNSMLRAGAALLLAALFSAAPLSSVLSQAPQAALQEIHVAYIGRRPPPPPLYDINAVPPDEGVAGGRIAIGDNNTTGRFMGQTYRLEEMLLDEGQSPVEAARKAAEAGAGSLVVNLPADELLAVTDALKDRNVLVFNVGAPDDRLRNADCRANLFHVAPSRAMMTDAVAQYLAAKRWRNVFLVTGPKAADQAYGEAMKRSIKKFGLKLVAEKPWEFGPLARQRADGPTQAEALVFTRGVEFDVLIVADESDDFGEYVPYHTWDPKLVVGTHGLAATTWHRAQDAFGSAQLQSRFLRTANRYMRPVDYQVWTAVRAIGEAATRTKSADPKELARFILGGAFELAAFKGVPVSFRTWNRQLRQPLLLAQPAAIVSIAPQPGYLHQRTPLDTLGFDQPESACKLQ